MGDTTPAAQEVRVAAIRLMETAERLRQALAWSETVRAVALARLRAMHPGRTDLELVELMTGARLTPDARPGSAR
jgi:hypothetical protein